LHLSQSCPATPEAAEKLPFLIPVEVGLLGNNGQDLIGTQVLRLTDAEQSFTFEQVAECPVPSLLRGFSAPVRLSYPYTTAELVFLMKHDNDAFNRWDAGQRLAMQTILSLLDTQQRQAAFGLEHEFISAYQAILTDR